MYGYHEVLREVEGLLDRAVRFDTLTRKNGNAGEHPLVKRMLGVAAEAERLLAKSPEEAGDFLHRNGYTPVLRARG